MSLLCVFCCFCLIRVFGDTGGVKQVSVTEGQSVTLHTDLTDIQTHDEIMWMFGSKETLIAEINGEVPSFNVYDGVLDGRFRHRLMLDYHTGSLTITNIRQHTAGVYKVQIINKKVSNKIFNVTLYARLSVPVISRDSSQCSSCALLCSVLNVSHVTLSWYNGSDLHSSISVSDLNIRLSLPLEVEYQDTNTYSCVLNNTITNHTTHLNIKEHCQSRSDDFIHCVLNSAITNHTRHLNITHDCHMCSAGAAHCCGFTEAVMRLVVSVLVGVATVAVLVYDVRSRRDEQRSQTRPSNADESDVSGLEAQESQ